MLPNYSKIRQIGMKLFLLLILLVTFYSCNDESDPLAVPSATTLQVSEITASSAEVSGIVTGQGIVSRGFVYGTAPSPTTDDNTVLSGSGAGDFSVTLTDIDPSTEYFVRAFASNEAGTSYGTERSFATLDDEPDFTVLTAEAISEDSIFVSGTIAATNPTEVGAILGNELSVTVDNAEQVKVSEDLSIIEVSFGELLPETTYYVRLFAVRAGEYFYSDAQGLTTLEPAFEISTIEILNITASTAEIEVAYQADMLTSKGIIYSIEQDPDFENGQQVLNTEETNPFTSLLEGLDPGVEYNAVAFVINDPDTAFSQAVSFITDNIPLSVGQPSISKITPSEATLTASVEGSNITGSGFIFNTSETLDFNNGTRFDSEISSGEITADLVSLEPSTSYFAASFVYSQEDTIFSAVVDFTTSANLPSVTTATISGIGDNSATGGGDAAGTDIIQKGLVWSTSDNPTIEDEKTEEGPGEGAFTSEITGLSPKTTYFVRSYATNEAGTSYGDQRSFITTGPLQVVSVTPADGATGVGRNENIRVLFDEDLDLSTITEPNFGVSTPSVGFDIAVQITQQTGSNTIVINPDSPLLYGEEYTLFIGTSVESAAGNTLSSSFSSSFTVEAEPDNVAPTFVSASPADGTQNVDPNTTLEFTFSEDIASARVSVTNRDAFTEEFGISRSIDGNVVRVSRSGGWRNATDYGVQIDNVSDLAGNPLADDVVYEFRTAAEPLTITSASISDGASDIEIDDVSFTFTFSRNISDFTVNTGDITLTFNGIVSDVDVPVSLDVSGNQITVTPNEILNEYLSNYTITLSKTGFLSTVGGTLGDDVDNTYEFSTVRYSQLFTYKITNKNRGSNQFLTAQTGGTSTSSDDIIFSGAITSNRQKWIIKLIDGTNDLYALEPVNFANAKALEAGGVGDGIVTRVSPLASGGNYFTGQRWELRIRTIGTREIVLGAYSGTDGFLNGTTLDVDTNLDGGAEYVWLTERNAKL